MTTQKTVFTYTNTGTDVLICQAIAKIGDGSDDLDGTGGEFEWTMLLGGNTVQPEPQWITFSTETRSAAFTEQFPLPVGDSVTFKLKSPNVADTSVWVRVCLYEVGVESIRDELAAIQSQLTSILVTMRNTTNVYDDTHSPGSGVYPTTSGSAAGVYPGRC